MRLSIIIEKLQIWESAEANFSLGLFCESNQEKLEFFKNVTEDINARNELKCQAYLKSAEIYHNDNETFKEMSSLEGAGRCGGNEAYVKLGDLYMERHQHLGTDQSLNDALEAYKKGANAGNPEAHFKLAFFNPKQSFFHYEKAAERGHTQAQYWLGNLYDSLDPRDLTNAMKWWREAADKGHPRAQSSYGSELVKSGQKSLGLEYLKKAADKDDHHAWEVLNGILYGTQGKHEYPELRTDVLNIFEELADKNSSNGKFQFIVADIYRGGLPGVDKNIEKAKKYFQRAVNADYPRAKKALERLEKPPTDT